jgi:5-methylcytosine-specific restriction endonuclease McrA
MIKTRNNNTMTEAGFWGMIRSALRRYSMYWKPIKAKKEQNRKPYKGLNKRQKWVYTCEICKREIKEKEIEIDHIVECGNLSKATAGEFIERLFCEIDGLQILCKECHQLKTNNRRSK